MLTVQRGSLIFSYIRRLGPFFGGFKIFQFQYLFAGFRKNDFFWEYEDFVDVCLGSDAER